MVTVPSQFNQTQTPINQTQTPAFKKKRSGVSIWLIAGLVIVVLLVILAYFVFTRPNTAPAAELFNTIFPSDSGLNQLQEVDLDINSIINHPNFSTLREFGPIPLQIPPLGKPNPFQ